MPKATRNRSKKPAWRFAAFSAEHWRADPAAVLWAQTAPQFKDLLSLAVNDRPSVLGTLPLGSESCLLGREQGYAALLEHLKQLAEGPPAAQPPPEQPTYQPDTSALSTPLPEWTDTEP
jgi:hypothetical protein